MDIKLLDGIKEDRLIWLLKRGDNWYGNSVYPNNSKGAVSPRVVWALQRDIEDTVTNLGFMQKVDE